MKHLVATGAVIAAALACPLAAVPSDAAVATSVWYVAAHARAAGDGSAQRPFDQLADAEHASRAGDVVYVLPSARMLDGGIRLKPRQTLVGGCPAVRGLAATAKAARLTNTTTRLAGDAVRLSDGATVRNLRITGARRGAVYGVDVTGVRVLGNDVSGHNTSCTPGFLIPQFNAPTNLPGVGIPIVGGLPNGWAGVMIDGGRRTGATATISGNVVRDAVCGDGIDVRTWGTASYQVTISGNEVHHLQQGEDFKSLLAIGLQTRGHSELVASVTGNVQRDLGNPDDLNVVVGADSEGVFVNGVGPSTLKATVERNIYTNVRGLGGFSANGLEMVTMGAGSRVDVVVRDSHFSGSPGDVIEEGALGTNARLSMVLERVTAERSTGIGNTAVVPFNNGDCLLAGSLGAGNDIRLTVRDSVLRGCSNNGLSVGSNVVNGSGPTNSIDVLVDRTRITGNRGGNLGIRNFTGLRSLSVKVRRSDLAGSRGLGSAFADVAAEDLGSTDHSVIEISDSCVDGPLFAAHVVRYDVAARQVWWGQPGGPGPLATTVLGGSLDSSSPLGERPAYCG
ncbi:hypothetical protein [Nocardioides speluncae]|uniref:hypothetical protein n=1 Tax=Nocardioides speluncae TaxID=2670337 RepID=UPI000D69E746|nr:hypothetical protein [Nocardioides speluncae]